MSWTYLSENTRKAQKQYRCCLCGRGIEKGELYRARSGADGGQAFTMHMHPKCSDFANKLYGGDQEAWECRDDWEFRREMVEAEKESRK